MTSVSASRPRDFRSWISPAIGRSVIRAMYRWVLSFSACAASQSSAPALPVKIWTKRTPRSTSLRAIRQSAPNFDELASSRP